MILRQSKHEIYLHLVWATFRRQPLITPALERPLYQCVCEEANRLGCRVLAIGGMPDHVHISVDLPTRLAVATLAKQIKGVSSHFIHDQFSNQEYFFWQEGYGVFSVSRSHLKRVKAYITGQKRHHAANTLWPEWEETDTEYEE